MQFAKGGQADHLAGANTPKAAVVNNAGREKDVQGVGATAANKLLVAIEEVIKKTVKNVLKKAKEKINESRNPKA
ncbi:Borrelia lipoprotein-containing protein (plasmid) [Borrelia crocidurae str. Achema]|uniref:Variable large protein n=1 Tax=Borrelia crocidurae (strain Achema) TaxID=1155096 RepID=I0FEM0_BORCA|nr:Borrelia lipoprotein-containing protein [Borrelia crocidurae str. Achema]